MALPEDPYMLLSCINTQLRDNCPSLSELAASCGEDEEEIRTKLEKAGFIYDAGLNRFVTGEQT